MTVVILDRARQGAESSIHNPPTSSSTPCSPDALAGIAWFNSLSRYERARWLDVAGSFRPCDAWAAYKRAGGAA